jgi:predicted CXXCH cytochrome family protein
MPSSVGRSQPPVIWTDPRRRQGRAFKSCRPRLRVVREGGAVRAALLLAMCGGLLGLIGLGCHEGQRGVAPGAPARLYPPPPQPPRVIALGTFRGAAAPSPTETKWSMFLFGAAPSPPLTIANPVGLAVDGQSLLICDGVLGAVMRWDAGLNQFTTENFQPPLDYPFAVDVTPAGERLVCDRQGAHRVTSDGCITCTYWLSDEPFKPGGVLGVRGQVWVTNLAGHCIEVFDGASCEHLRSISGPSEGEGQLAWPTALARMPDGNVCVVDVLKNRVQVFSPEGRWLRSIGGPGDSVGQFGRPKSVAVAPDGVVFVTDAFSQRVQAFAPDGEPLLAFGEPGSGVGALTLPAGIAVSTMPLPADLSVSAGVSPDYYVLVAEQLNQPGIRVYAWLRGSLEKSTAVLPAGAATGWKPSFPGAAALNPHFDPARCTVCHTAAGDRVSPIAPEAVDGLCLSCHDGVKAPAEPHPIGRKAETAQVHTPDDWPTLDGLIGCLTCHDMQIHRDPAARRPASNPMLLRNWDPQRPLEWCSNCHATDVGRFSPHRQRDATGRVREDACLFCHTRRPKIPADGRRSFEPHLRAQTSKLCLNCHTRHWDLSPRGHVDRPVTPKIRHWMLMQQFSLETDAGSQQLSQLARQAERPPALLPLGNLPDGTEVVTCYTCHNPHYPGLLPPCSELGARATNPQDRAAALRTNWIDLCSECHRR